MIIFVIIIYECVFVFFQDSDKMDKVYKRYKDSKMNPQKLMDELGLEGSDGDTLGMGVIRKEMDLNNDEKQYLLAVERGDMASVRKCLEESQIYFNVNINCVDPLGRSALLIAIENENLEIIQLLLTFNVEVGDSLLHAINEENVEAVELLLKHQEQNGSNKKDLMVRYLLREETLSYVNHNNQQVQVWKHCA